MGAGHIVNVLLCVEESLQHRLEKSGVPNVGLLEAYWREERLVKSNGLKWELAWRNSQGTKNGWQ